MKAIEHLNALADERKARKHPAVPYPVKSKYKDSTANGLTRAIVDYLTLNGHFATRLASTGSYRADVGKFIPSQQRAGLPDILAVVNGHGQAVFVEVKAGKDRLSEVQKQAIADLVHSGAMVYVARDFEGFYGWFQDNFKNLPF